MVISPTLISIHAPREGGDRMVKSDEQHKAISIHAPREGGDNNNTVVMTRLCDFNPRPPRGGRLCGVCPRPDIQGFQSTPPARGATSMMILSGIRIIFQSTPPARGATKIVETDSLYELFQSTPPARGATL